MGSLWSPCYIDQDRCQEERVDYGGYGWEEIVVILGVEFPDLVYEPPDPHAGYHAGPCVRPSVHVYDGD